MKLFLSIVIVAPLAVYLCVLLTRAADWVHYRWTDITIDKRWMVITKSTVVFLAWIILLSILTELSALGIYYLSEAL